MIKQKPVPNYNIYRKGQSVKAIVIHIGEGTKDQIYNTFNNELNKVSSHYLVCMSGEIWQFVKEEDTAWHAGLVVNPTAKVVLDNLGVNPNLISIGIEHEGWGVSGINDIQYQKSADLIQDICGRYNLPIDSEHIISHNSIRANKSCPGAISVDKLIRIASEYKVKVNFLKQIISDLIIKINLLKEKIWKKNSS